MADGCSFCGSTAEPFSKQEPGLAWLERQAEVADELVALRKRTAENRPGS
jgi:hypothetical protein